jgi:hypothetical protein
MSTFDKATGALTIGNTIWLAAMTLYLYKSLTALKAGLIKQSEITTAIIKQLGDIKDSIRKIDKLSEAVRLLDDAVCKLEDKVMSEDMSNDMDLFQEQFERILSGLGTHGISVENLFQETHPPHQGQPSARPTGRRRRSSSNTSSRPESQDSWPSRSRPTTPAKVETSEKADRSASPPPSRRGSRHRQVPAAGSTIMSEDKHQLPPRRNENHRRPINSTHDDGLASASDFDAEAAISAKRKASAESGSRRSRSGVAR